MTGVITTLSVENTRRNRAILENSPLLVKFMCNWKEVDDVIHIDVLTHHKRQFGKYLLDSGMNYAEVK